MKRLLLLLTVFSVSLLMNAQSNFQKAISIPFMSTPIPKSIIQCSDGGYLIGSSSGYLYSSTGANLIKTDALGQVTWTKTYSSGSGYMNLVQIGECNGGGYYIFGDNTDSAWMSSGFSLTKIDASGNVLWGKAFPNSNAGYGSSKIRVTNDGGFLISESLYSKMGALKLDGNGNVLWHTAYTDDPTDQSPKCPSFDCFINGDGSMVFSGKRNSDILLVKTNTTGQMQWSSTIGNGSSYYHANGISNTADGGYIVCGYDNFYPFCMKVSSTGAIQWYHLYANADGGEFIQIKEQPNGNFIAIGDDGYYANTFVVHFDASGNILSSSIFGDNNGAGMSSPSMCSTSDGGIAITGTYSNPTSGLTAISIMKTDVNGNFGCNFNSYPMSFSAAQITPSVLSVPIYSIPQTSSSSALSISSTSLSATEMEFCLLFGVNDIVGNEISLSAFPSPIASGENLQLNISGIEGSSDILIYDANGKVVKEFNREFSLGETTTFEVSTIDLSTGIYLVRITGVNQEVLGVTKFIVR